MIDSKIIFAFPLHYFFFPLRHHYTPVSLSSRPYAFQRAFLALKRPIRVKTKKIKGLLRVFPNHSSLRRKERKSRGTPKRPFKFMALNVKRLHGLPRGRGRTGREEGKGSGWRGREERGGKGKWVEGGKYIYSSFLAPNEPCGNARLCTNKSH